MPFIHTVKQGECLSSIAALYGFADYRTIYDDPANAELARRRKDPHLLFPGDCIVIPDNRHRQVACKSGQLHVFSIKRTRRFLRLILKDAEDKALANLQYTLQAGNEHKTGTTNPDGLLEAWIRADVEEAQLTLLPDKLCISLRIGHLDPVEHDDSKEPIVSGIQARLNNLGFASDGIDGQLGEPTRSALRRFQEGVLRRQDPDGAPDAETRSTLSRMHGC